MVFYFGRTVYLEILIEFYRKQKHLLLYSFMIKQMDQNKLHPSVLIWERGGWDVQEGPPAPKSSSRLQRLTAIIFFLKLLASQFQHPLKHQPLPWEPQHKKPPANPFWPPSPWLGLFKTGSQIWSWLRSQGGPKMDMHSDGSEPEAQSVSEPACTGWVGLISRCLPSRLAAASRRRALIWNVRDH